MNIVDILILVLVVATILRGIEVGFVRQIGSLAGLIAGLLLGTWLAAITGAGNISSLLMIVLAIIAGVGAGEYASLKAKHYLRERVVNHADRALGGLVGVVTCLALVWLGSTVVSAIPAQEVQRSVRDSRVIAWLDDTLPPASTIVAQLEDSLARTGLPDLLEAGEPDLDVGDAQLPPLASFAGVIAETRDSIVELEGRSCQGIGVGSGFVVESNLVVTNAHVVAGMRHPYVRDDNGRHDAEVVAFDDELDIAVLRVGGLAGEPLALETDTVEVDTEGVVLGYPGGGPFTPRPARVAESFQALGRDIYEEQPTQRTVLALRANIEPGNSGGPLLDHDGEVTGVIFARSTAYENVGYAVTSEDVQDVITQAERAPNRGTSLRCL